MTPDHPTPEQSAEVLLYLQERSSPDIGGCWVWDKALTEDGYGRAWWQGQDWRAHRLAYHYLVGFLPKSTVVHHTCGNRACWRPNHLQATSHHANVAEMLGRVYYEEEIEHLREEVARLNKELVMSACEKCWNDAYVRSRTRGTAQADEYRAIIREREQTPCSPSEQSGEAQDA